MDNVNHPAHYQGKHECIDEMIALFGVEDVKPFAGAMCINTDTVPAARADRRIWIRQTGTWIS